ncbi:related to UBP1-ubiquitin-specific protease [Sporisorium reilianum f. sp. reilianum]|uniref:Ubiquitin carboxyl-terminal hydrolase n=1 Tax=Sporisorium reilianum f. sp. reilianum TaxID=72559 RepID=A0A2N8UM98_9BASI|nr:related to UBP1-ubiquitin-specific protease [Sporisorium reilianum f. sp. reilianum]
MGGYRFVLVKPAARPAYPLFGVLPLPATVPIQALLALGALLIVLIALAAYSDMLKPGLQAASRLHPYTPSALSSDKPQSLRRARPAASTSSSRASSTSRARLSNPKYKGLRNTGNTCFFNSTLQSISSLSLYRKYLYFLVQQAERWDTPTPVIDALLELIEELATPGDRNAAINPVQLVRALQNLPSSSIRSLVGAHQQQDAHELFALLNEAVDSEAKAIQHERSGALDTEQAGLRALMAPSLSWSGRGVYADPAHAQTKQAINGTSNPLQVLGMAPHDGSASASADAPTASSDDMLMISPFDALLAQRTICLDCGYCEAIRHFSTSEISLSAPALNVRTRTSDITGTSACSLQECLALWSDLEQVDWICWNCTLRNTLQAVQADIAFKGPAPVAAKPNGAAANGDAHASANGSSLTPAKKKRLAQLRSKEAKLNRILQSGLSEDELRQASEDAASPWHNVLNNIQLKKTISRLSTKQIMISRPPRILALHLNRSSYSASSWAPSKNNRHVLFPEYLDLADFTLQGSISLDGRLAMNSSSAHSLSDAEREGTADSIYRLAAIVVHYGSHSFGHYIAFKRISAHEGGCDAIADAGEADADGWLRISDESVTRATIQQVKQENPYMLFYELMPSRAHVLQQQGKMELPDGGADYATLQRAIAGAMAAQGHGQMQDEVDDAAGSARASPAPGSLRIRPRTVHRWSTPPVA